MQYYNVTTARSFFIENDPFLMPCTISDQILSVLYMYNMHIFDIVYYMPYVRCICVMRV